MPFSSHNRKTEKKPLQAHKKTGRKQILFDINPFIHRQKRASASASRKRLGGSMTVEASLLMSFFLLAVNVLFYFFFLMEFQVELQFAMERQVREVTISQAEGLAGSLWIQGAVRGELQTEGRGISLGDRGIRFIRNQGGETEGEYLDITAVFQAGPPLKLFGSMEGTYIQRCRRRFWTGQDFVGESDTKEDSEETEYVYVTQSGTVYHRKRSCSYLKPSVRSSNYSALPDLRNKDGSKYRACERCTKNSGMQQTIYITDFGDRYHGSKNCSSLNRWIMKVSIEETGGKPPCSKCGR